MKKTYLMLLLAMSGLGSGCTNDDGTTESPSGAGGEIQLVFSGSGESEEYTKAIASNSENEIKNLKVYLLPRRRQKRVMTSIITWKPGRRRRQPLPETSSSFNRRALRIRPRSNPES